MVAAVARIPFLFRFLHPIRYEVLVVTWLPLLFGVFKVPGMRQAVEGLRSVRRDFGFCMYTAFFAVVPHFMLRVKSVARPS
jgi:hypothetical protein